MNRFLHPNYVFFTLKLKLKSKYLQFIHWNKSPFEFFPKNYSITKPKIHCNQINNYISLGYFNYEQCMRYHGDNAFITILIIKALVYFNEEHMNPDLFLSKVDQILMLGSESGDYFFFPIDTELKKYNLEAGFISGIVQGKAASLLVRAYQISGDIKYLHWAKKCIQTFTLPIDKGGILRKWSDEQLWVEEYPDPRSPNMVLNGHLFSIIGLADFLAHEPVEMFIRLYHAMIHSTLHYLNNYKVDGGLLYSLHDWTLCNIHYLGIMQPLLSHAYAITGIEEFKDLERYIAQLGHPRLFIKLLQ